MLHNVYKEETASGRNILLGVALVKKLAEI